MAAVDGWRPVADCWATQAGWHPTYICTYISLLYVYMYINLFIIHMYIQSDCSVLLLLLLLLTKMISLFRSTIAVFHCDVSSDVFQPCGWLPVLSRLHVRRLCDDAHRQQQF